MYKLITFDMYTALLDIFTSAVPLVKDVMPQWSDEECEKYFTRWRSEQWLYMLLSGCTKNGFVSYEDITKRAQDYTEFKLNMHPTPEQKEELFHHVWKNFKVWPETKEVIDELKNRGYLVAMLSNGDYNMLAPLQDANNIKFDYILSADMARCHKPGPDIYYLPITELGIGKQEFLHVCGSANDLMGAVSAGINVAWHNRKQDRTYDPNIKPIFETKDLYGLLDYLPPVR
ncbi:MAG: HAD hydrolase-like protein [Clostridia bacterium]|nr:HAD hydrolase-like protein [Clostridia bacterium]